MLNSIGYEIIILLINVNILTNFWSIYFFGPRCKKTCLRGFRQSKNQTSLLSYRDLLEDRNLLVASLDVILSSKRLTKALIRMCRCAGWSASLLFPNTEDRFSRVKAHLIACNKIRVSCNYAQKSKSVDCKFEDIFVIS